MLIAAILIIFGVYMAIAPTFRSYFMGFWSVLVGLFLFDAAYSVCQARTRADPKYRQRSDVSTILRRA
jgi:hypothetical protein